MGLRPHYLLDVLVGGFSLLTLAVYFLAVSRVENRPLRIWLRFAFLVGATILSLAVMVAPLHIANKFPNVFVQWIRCLSIFVAAWALYSIPIAGILRWGRPHRPERRRLLKTAAVAALAAPPIVAAAAFINRDRLTLQEIEVFIPGLPADLNGLRLVQLSDIHLSPLVSERLLTRSVDMANETKANLALVTGDLVSRVGDPLDTCLQGLSRLRTDAGTYGCLGNHEVYAESEEYTTKQGARLGMQFLRSQSRPLRFGNAILNLAGVDYQKRGTKYLVGAESLLIPDATNVLLSHNPDVFPVAASKGFDLTIGGHTHGGQVNFEILKQNVNIVRFFTPYVYGRYVRDGRSLFVTRGIGTVGAPARLGAPPEVALIRLCAS